LPYGSHAFALRLQGGLIDKMVDPFFYIYAGGLPGMRGYSYYSLGGERTAVATATYRFPIVKRAAWTLYPLSINHIYGNIFCDVGDAWVGDFDEVELKKDVGAGLRIQMHSFYFYPTAVGIDVAYGFDRFTNVEEDFQATYGKEWRYYLTILFDFYTPFHEGIARSLFPRW
jgi:outer membrane protein assembly factor BamA